MKQLLLLLVFLSVTLSIQAQKANPKYDADLAKKVGADDYLNKPFDSEVLLMKIKAIIQRKSVDSLADSKKFEFIIGEFSLNSKLRFLSHNS